jgi:Tfp pilus assembly protein PilN
MIQFNLLPDVKLEYIRSRRTKRMVTLASSLIAGCTLAILVILFLSVHVIQRQHINNLNRDIAKDTTTLKAVPDLDKILTVQNQLKSLPDLNNKKPVSSRMLDYLVQLTPTQVSISHIVVNFADNTVAVTGKADSLEVINKYADTIKFTKYKVAGSEDQTAAFSGVVLKNFGRDDKLATYEINYSFDPVIFDSSKDITLVVPKIVTTGSETEKPKLLFQQSNTQQVTR